MGRRGNWLPALCGRTRWAPNPERAYNVNLSIINPCLREVIVEALVVGRNRLDNVQQALQLLRARDGFRSRSVNLPQKHWQTFSEG